MGMMAIPLIVAGGAMSAISQINSGAYNKRLSDVMANDAQRRGDVQSSLALLRGGRADAGALAAAGGAGIDAGSESVGAVRGGSRLMSSLDAATIRSNALREAYGYHAQGVLASKQATSGAISTLLTTAGSAGSAAYKAGMLNGPGLPDPSTSYEYADAFDAGNFPALVRGA